MRANEARDDDWQHAILASQLAATSWWLAVGEKRLWAAVVYDALWLVKTGLRDQVRYGRVIPTGYINTQSFRRACDWIESDQTYPLGFLWVCDVLDLDPDFVRAEAYDWTRPIRKLTWDVRTDGFVNAEAE